MSNVSRNGLALLTMIIVSAALAGGCKDDPAANPGPGGAPGTAGKAPDLSNPKSSAVSFAKAVQSNDMAAAKAASTGTDEQYKMVEAMGQMMSGYKNYESAAVAKFGDAGKSKEMSMPDVVADTEGSDVKTEGDTATVVNPKKPNDKDPMKLVKKDGQWRVDLASIPMDEQSKMMAATAPKMKKAFDEAAEEIKAGKLNTPEEAQKALRMKMEAAMAPG